MSKWKVILMAVLLIFLAACGGNANQGSEAEGETTDGGADWKPDSIDVIVPLSPGGGVERRSRVIAKHFEELHGVPLNIEMKEGGGTVVGTNHFLENTEPDGSTIYINWEYAFTGGVFRGATYGLDDFQTIASYTDIHLGLVVNADSEWQTFEEFVEYAKANPGSVNLGGTTGSTDQIVTEAFINAFDLDVNFVPYDGGGDVRSDVAGGHIDGMIGGVETAWSAFGPEEMRTLTMFANESDELNELAPQEVTYISDEMAEHYPDIEVPDVFTDLTNWHFIAVSAEMREKYPERFDVLVEMFDEALATSGLREEAKENYWIVEPKLADEAQEHWEWVHSVANDNKKLFIEE